LVGGAGVPRARQQRPISGRRVGRDTIFVVSRKWFPTAGSASEGFENDRHDGI
jgi:hypothetical protein